MHLTLAPAGYPVRYTHHCLLLLFTVKVISYISIELWQVPSKKYKNLFTNKLYSGKSFNRGCIDVVGITMTSFLFDWNKPNGDCNIAVLLSSPLEFH